MFCHRTFQSFSMLFSCKFTGWKKSPNPVAEKSPVSVNCHSGRFFAPKTSKNLLFRGFSRWFSICKVLSSDEKIPLRLRVSKILLIFSGNFEISLSLMHPFCWCFFSCSGVRFGHFRRLNASKSWIYSWGIIQEDGLSLFMYIAGDSGVDKAARWRRREEQQEDNASVLQASGKGTQSRFLWRLPGRWKPHLLRSLSIELPSRLSVSSFWFFFGWRGIYREGMKGSGTSGRLSSEGFCGTLKGCWEENLF